MIGHDEMAARMFGATTPSGQEPPAGAGESTLLVPAGAAVKVAGLVERTPTVGDTGGDAQPIRPRTDEEMARALYGTKPTLPEPDEPESEEMRDIRQSPERRLFGKAEADAAVPAEMFSHLVGTRVEVGDGTLEITAPLAEKALVEVRAMVADLGLNQDDVQTMKQGFTHAQALTDEASVIASRETAVEALNKEFGQQAALALRAARAYVAANPKLSRILEQTRAGDSPQAVLTIAKRALPLVKAGRLRLAPGKK